jgi:hypothetical protein
MKYRNILLLSLVFLSVSSCKKFLQEKPLTFLSSSNFYKTSDDLTAAIYSVYAPLQTYYTGGAYANMTWAIWELPSDQSYSNDGAGVIDNTNLDNYAWTPDIAYFNNWWKNAYLIISRANTVITNTPGATAVSDDIKNSILAEARFMRGLAYFELTMGYGDVPLIKETSTELFPTRSPSLDVYNFAIADLQFAEQHLPATWPKASDYGRATKYAAKAYLAKLYLKMAGYPIKDVSKFALAAAEAKDVITNGPYSLYTNVMDNWNPAAAPKEQIFIVDKSRAVSNGSYFPLFWAPRGLTQLAAVSGADFIGAFLPNQSFYNDFPNNDPRKAQFFMTSARSYMDTTLVLTLAQPTVAKYWGPMYNDGTDQDIVRLRYAEVLLTYAEAANEVSATPADAYTALNAVRARAFGNTSQNYSGLTQDAFRQAVWRERDLELCFEGVRWIDMVRTQTSRTGGILDYKNINNLSPTAKNMLFPLPTTDLATNQKLTQNPGY